MKIIDNKEIQATVSELPLEPPSESLQIVKQRQNKALLIYRAAYVQNPLSFEKEKSVLVKCTECSEQYYLEYRPLGQGCSRGYGIGNDPFGFIDPFDNETKKSYSTCLCPACGAQGEALHIGKFKTTATIEKSNFMTLHNVRGHLTLLSWILFKECDKNANVKYNVKLYEGITIINNQPIRLTGYDKTMYYGVSWDNKWTARPKFRDNIDVWDLKKVINFNQKTFESTESANSALDVFIKEGGSELRIAAYLQIWTKYPQIENLIRNGFSPYVSRLIKTATFQTGYSYNLKQVFYISEINKYINTKKKKPTEILGIDKEDLNLVNKYPIDVLSFYSFIKKNYNIKLDENQIRIVTNLGVSDMKSLFNRTIREDFTPAVIRTINYLQKEKKINDRSNCFITPRYLYDYWNMLNQVYNSLPKELIFPRNLIEAHDKIALKLKEKSNEIINRGIMAFADSLKWLNYSDDETGLFIRVCANHNELIEEGKKLHHCVATYAKSFSQKETCILFIREIKNPETPFYTLEYKGGKVIQNRGKRNCDRTEAVQKFEKKWLDYIKNYKEIKKNGKQINRNQSKQRTSA